MSDSTWGVYGDSYGDSMELIVHVVVAAAIAIPPIVTCYWSGVPVAEVYTFENVIGVFRWKI